MTKNRRSIMRKAAVMMIFGLLAAANAFSGDRIRDFFEWGEYDSLFVSLGGYFSAQHDTVASDTACIYFSYLGVAYFAKGDIAEAGRQFRKSLDCQPALTLDKKYVTPEMMNLFASIKNDREQQLAFSVQEKSIQEDAVTQHYEQESMKQQAAELRSSFWKNTAVAAATGLISLTLGSLAVYEYTNANTGPVIQCSTGAAICGCLAVVFTVKSVSLHRKTTAQLAGIEERPLEVTKEY